MQQPRPMRGCETYETTSKRLDECGKCQEF